MIVYIIVVTCLSDLIKSDFVQKTYIPYGIQKVIEKVTE